MVRYDNMRRHFATSFLLVGCLTVVAGCRTESSNSPNGSTPSASGGTPQARDGKSVVLTASELTAFERGLQREIEAVRAAQARSASAKTAQERGEAIQASFETATIPLGAEAAGLSVERYSEVRETVNGVLRTLDFQGKIDGPLSIDLSRVDAETKARLSRDAYADLPEQSATALRAHLDQILPIWIAYMKLTAVAG